MCVYLCEDSEHGPHNTAIRMCVRVCVFSWISALRTVGICMYRTCSVLICSQAALTSDLHCFPPPRPFPYSTGDRWGLRGGRRLSERGAGLPGHPQHPCDARVPQEAQGHRLSQRGGGPLALQLGVHPLAGAHQGNACMAKDQPAADLLKYQQHLSDSWTLTSVLEKAKSRATGQI